MFSTVCFVGIGLINASLALAMRQAGLAKKYLALDISESACATAQSLGIVDIASGDPAQTIPNADLVVLGVPVGAMSAVSLAITPYLKKGTIITDVGSVKMTVIRDVIPLLPEYVDFIPGHPIAGTEYSGPESGFSSLFEQRWCVLTPLPATSKVAEEKITTLWQKVGAMVTTMTPHHHDRVLAITSHLPHLIAYTIVGTASDLESSLRQEIIKFSASGFRDFTRIAASDPVMWRDVFLHNKDAVLDILQRFNEDLTALQRAIRWGEGDVLEQHFNKTRSIRKAIVDANQD